MPQTYETTWRDVSPRPAAVPLRRPEAAAAAGPAAVQLAVLGRENGRERVVYTVLVVGAQVGLRPRRRGGAAGGLVLVGGGGCCWGPWRCWRCSTGCLRWPTRATPT
ncbi:MAG: hypothetical protein WKG07_12360 [Hymenobacter sp.]